MNQFLIKIKWSLSVLALLLSLSASAQLPETYAYPWSNSGAASHGVGTGANGFSVITGGSYDAFTFGSGTDIFAGPGGVAGSQEIGGTIAPQFGTLVVNTGAGNMLNITNTAGVTIGTGVTFTSGVLSNRALGSGAPLAFLNGSTSPTASSSGYVDGYVSKTGTTAFTFPVGDLSAAAGTQYHPLAIGIPSGPTTVTAAYSAGAPPNSSSLDLNVTSIDPGTYWSFNSTAGVTSVITVTTPDESAVYGSGAVVFLAGYNTSTGQWENVSGGFSFASGDNQTLSSNVINMSLYSGFAVGSTIFPLPITLVSFTGTADGCNADLAWQTAMEQNSDHYEIELSTDGSHFSKVAEVKSRNSAMGATYNYQYKGLSSSVNYFRLRAVDADGKAAYSPVVVITSACTVGGRIVVSPNPSSDLVNIQGLDEGSNHIMLFDAGGKKLTEQVVTGTSQSLHIGRYAGGMYILRIINANGKIVNIKVIRK